MTMVNPATIGLAQKLAAHSADVLALAQTAPHVTGLFAQGKKMKAQMASTMMKQQIISFSSGALVATLVGVLALKFGRKPAFGEVSQHDDENPTSRPMLEQAEQCVPKQCSAGSSKDASAHAHVRTCSSGIG